jgi:hypothetical protein
MNNNLYAEFVEFLSKGMRAALATNIVTKGATHARTPQKC